MNPPRNLDRFGIDERNDTLGMGATRKKDTESSLQQQSSSRLATGRPLASSLWSLTNASISASPPTHHHPVRLLVSPPSTFFSLTLINPISTARIILCILDGGAAARHPKTSSSTLRIPDC